ncbi:hypothetical protein NGM99_13845 [Mesorhizobium sp. RP14(2022)]|uniref:Uncharacterized protein n=1 Tax=Mesorhizobium liriopis TaxID=2953882 RepID=A0ABT1C7P7_9HYPH|nr:hypothetical protein [Mesorhizobium liriopis]MCO6050862.1 hypothetical protein [Mesorhizobium liriopis]
MNHSRIIILSFLTFVVVSIALVSFWGFDRVGSTANGVGAETSAPEGN